LLASGYLELGSSDGRLVGIYINGGCDSSSSGASDGSNLGQRISAVIAASPTLQALLGLTKIYDDVFKPVVGKQLLDNPITLKFRDDPVETLKFNDDLKSPGLGKPPGLEGKQPGSLLALYFVLFAVAGRASHRARSPSHYHPHRWGPSRCALLSAGPALHTR
jgi:hypothetical protein